LERAARVALVDALPAGAAQTAARLGGLLGSLAPGSIKAK
jgi:hypothetical protein